MTEAPEVFKRESDGMRFTMKETCHHPDIYRVFPYYEPGDKDMTKSYFIMIYLNDTPTPLMEEDEHQWFSMILFDSIEEAKKVAEDHRLCQIWGYEIFKTCGGVYP